MSVIDIHDTAPVNGSRVDAADSRDRVTESRDEAARTGFEISSKAALRLEILATPFLPLLNRALTYAITPWSTRTGDHVLVNVPAYLLFTYALAAVRDAVRRLEHERTARSLFSGPGLMAIAALLASALSAGAIIAQWLQIAIVPVGLCAPQ